MPPIDTLSTESRLSGMTKLQIEDILGIAVFDTNGLPCQYFITEESPSTSWVQIVFQALGLRTLLASSLELEGFQQITICLEETTAILIRRREDYIALQFRGKLSPTSLDKQQLAAFINALDSKKLEQHPHFRLI